MISTYTVVVVFFDMSFPVAIKTQLVVSQFTINISVQLQNTCRTNTNETLNNRRDLSWEIPSAVPCIMEWGLFDNDAVAVPASCTGWFWRNASPSVASVIAAVARLDAVTKTTLRINVKPYSVF